MVEAVPNSIDNDLRAKLSSEVIVVDDDDVASQSSSCPSESSSYSERMGIESNDAPNWYFGSMPRSEESI